MRLLSPHPRWVVAAVSSLTIVFGLAPASAQPSTAPDQATSPTSLLAVSPDGLISRSSAGLRVDATGATGGSVSADGSMVVFESASNSLDRGDVGNDVSDVFVRDRSDGITVDASRAPDGTPGNGRSFDGRLSANGRYVAFSSVATNLVRNDTNEAVDAFVHDLETGVTRLASLDRRGRQLEQPSRLIDISDNGQKVLLAVQLDPLDSDSGDGDSGDADSGGADSGGAAETVELRIVDWANETVEVIGTSAGSVGDDVAPSASLSGDGTTVAFRTVAALVAQDANDDVDIYLRDLQAPEGGAITRISAGVDVGTTVLLAADGSAVFFAQRQQSADWNLVRFDLETNTAEIVSVDEDGAPVEDLGSSVAFGANRAGSSVVFSTDTAIGADRNRRSDVFQRDLLAEVTNRVSIERHGLELVGSSFLGGTARSVSDDGLVVAFTSTSSELVPNDINGATDVFVATPAATCDSRFITVFLSAGELPSERDDVILGTSRGDRVDAGGGDDVVCGAGGTDVILGGDGDDRLFGEFGNDIIEGGEGRDLIDGGTGDDKLYGDEDRDNLRGGSGADLLVGGPGRDRLAGGAGVDRLLGEKGADVLDGGSGNDELFGGASNDKLIGRGGDDVLRGGGGNDNLKAGGGNDSLDGGDGIDRMVGGRGVDNCAVDPASLEERRSGCESNR